MTPVQMWNESNHVFDKRKCLIDTGAFRNCLDIGLCKRLNLHERDHPAPYDAIGANGQVLARITRQARCIIKFGSYVDIVHFDLMQLGALQCVLGRD